MFCPLAIYNSHMSSVSVTFHGLSEESIVTVAMPALALSQNSLLHVNPSELLNTL